MIDHDRFPVVFVVWGAAALVLWVALIVVLPGAAWSKASQITIVGIVCAGCLHRAGRKAGRPDILTVLVGPALALGLMGLLARGPEEASIGPVIVAAALGTTALVFGPHLHAVISAAVSPARLAAAGLVGAGAAVHLLTRDTPGIAALNGPPLILAGLLVLFALDEPEWLRETSLTGLWPILAIALFLVDTRDIALTGVLAIGWFGAVASRRERAAHLLTRVGLLAVVVPVVITLVALIPGTGVADDLGQDHESVQSLYRVARGEMVPLAADAVHAVGTTFPRLGLIVGFLLIGVLVWQLHAALSKHRDPLAVTMGVALAAWLVVPLVIALGQASTGRISLLQLDVPFASANVTGFAVACVMLGLIVATPSRLTDKVSGDQPYSRESQEP